MKVFLINTVILVGLLALTLSGCAVKSEQISKKPPAVVPAGARVVVVSLF